MTESETKLDAVKTESEDEKNEMVIRLSRKQIQALKAEYKRPPTEKEKIRNEMLRQKTTERHAKARELKAQKEAEALAKLKVSMTAKTPKPKVKKTVEISDDNSDSEDFNEFQKFKEMKRQKKLEPKLKPDPKPKEESDDDGFIQNKQKKAVAVIETINKLDTAISKINSNPYLALFNQKL
jgi:hypothetical protein